MLGKHLEEKAKGRASRVIKKLMDLSPKKATVIRKNKEITIHPLLTVDKLGDLVKTVRSQIVQMYISCEKDFVEIIDLYEAIIESQLKKSVDMKMKNIEALTQGTLAK